MKRITWLLVLVAIPAIAATINVPEDHTTIFAALQASQPGDEIVVQPGLYQENPVHCAWGVTLRSATPGEYVEIDLMGGNPMAIACAGAPTTLSWLKIRNGGNGGLMLSGDPYGGSDAEATLEHCVITQNSGDYSGLSIGRGNMDSADIVIRDCEISENSSTGPGGGISAGDETNQCTIIMERVTVRANTSEDRGGGLATWIPVEALDCEFLDNTAPRGGGVATSMLSPAATFQDCVFSGNAASVEGGGFYAGMDGSVEFHGSAFDNNTAPAGPDGWVTSLVSVLMHCCEYEDGGVEFDPDAMGFVVDNENCGVAVQASSLSQIKALFR